MGAEEQGPGLGEMKPFRKVVTRTRDSRNRNHPGTVAGTVTGNPATENRLEVLEEVLSGGPVLGPLL